MCSNSNGQPCLLLLLLLPICAGNGQAFQAQWVQVAGVDAHSSYRQSHAFADVQMCMHPWREITRV
jgi:hypothetical protein